MSRKLLVILLVFGLLVGNVVHVPAARAAGELHKQLVEAHGSSYTRMRFYVPSGTPFEYISGSVTIGGYDNPFVYQGNRTGENELAFERIGAPYLGSGTFAVSWYIITNLGVMQGSGTVELVPWIVSFSAEARTFSVPFEAAPPPPLSVSLAGAFTTQIGVPYTCTAIATGGTAPYRYLFSIDWVTVMGGVPQYDNVYTGSLTSSGTFTYTFTFVGEFLIRVTVLDAVDAEAGDTLDLNAGVNKPAVWGQIYDIPDGDALKTYINFKLFPPTTAQGSPPIAGDTAIGTSNYSVTSPGTVEQGSNYYMLTPCLITALPNPLLVYVNYRDPVSKQTWSYVFSFDTTGWAAGSGALSNGDTWTGAETPGAFAWLWDLLVKLFRFLFVPTSSDFTTQIAAGWVVITSPVPAVVPQYTIPFPNPDHMLAATGESVNIDFGVVRDYTGYAIIKTIVQVVLDAILVFVVLSLVA
jgi:hypothetical protein